MQLSKSIIDQIKQAYVSGINGVSSFEFACEGPFLEHLSQVSISPIIYFSTPNQNRELVGLGQWATYSNDEAEHFLKNNNDQNIVLFGGNSFQKNLEGQQMPTERWILPILIFVKDHQQITCRVIFDKRVGDSHWGSIQTTLDAVFNHDGHNPTSKTPYLSLSHTPEKEAWVKNINHLKNVGFLKKLKKVVLARKTTVVFPSKINPFLMIKDIQKNDPNVYHFVVQFSQHYAFIGERPNGCLN